jgi:hypothetical protein
VICDERVKRQPGTTRRKILVAIRGYGCLLLLFPGLIILIAYPYISFELSNLLWLYGLLGGDYTRTSFDSALLSTSYGMLPFKLTLFNSSLTFFCLFIALAVMLWGLPVANRVLALAASLPVLYLGSLVRFILIYYIKDLFGPGMLPIFEMTTGAVIAFFFVILAFIVFAYMLLPGYVRDAKIPADTIRDFRDRDEIVFCYNCGKKVPEGAYFCPYCGKRLRETKIFTGWQGIKRWKFWNRSDR